MVGIRNHPTPEKKGDLVSTAAMSPGNVAGQGWLAWAVSRGAVLTRCYLGTGVGPLGPAGGGCFYRLVNTVQCKRPQYTEARIEDGGHLPPSCVDMVGYDGRAFPWCQPRCR